MVAKTKKKKKTARKSAVKRSSPGKRVVALHPLDWEPHPLSHETQVRDEQLTGLLYVAQDGTENHPVPEELAGAIYSAAYYLANAEVIRRGYGDGSENGEITIEAADSRFWQAWNWHYIAMLGAMPKISGLSPKFIATCKKKAG